MNTAWMGMDCQALASVVMAWLGQAIVFGTLLAALTWLLVRLLGHRIPPAVEALFWTVVLIKFLVPVGPVWSFSLESPCHEVSIPVADQPGAISAGADPVPSSPLIERTVDHTDPLRLSTVLALCYLVCAAYRFIKRMRSHRALIAWCRTLPLADDPVRRMVSNACQRQGLSRAPSVRISQKAPVSFITGYFHPVMVLSHNQLVRPNELESVILHEIAHLRRGDMFVRYLQWIAGSLLFFWPIVAWVNRRIDAAREHACDEWALSQGKLAAADYARCILHAMQPVRLGRTACPATSLASNNKNMERRIDMILGFSKHSSKRHHMGLMTLVALLLWSGFALSGAVEVSSTGDWPATEDGVKEHAKQVFGLVADIKTADINGDGELTYVEKDAFLVALAMMEPQSFMETFPYADRNQSGRLDYLEVYGVIRGITLIAYADRRLTALQGGDQLDLEFCHTALYAQEWLLDQMIKAPEASTLDNIWSVIKRVQGPPTAYHHRMLDHGGPVLSTGKEGKRCKTGLNRFHELEGNINALRIQLNQENDPVKAAKLAAMLNKLESLLARLENS